MPPGGGASSTCTWGRKHLSIRSPGLHALVHRAKTLGAWKVRRTELAELCWTSPLGRNYIVGPRGTRPSASMIRRRE